MPSIETAHQPVGEAPEAVPTPDFYRYRWDHLAKAEVDGRFVVLTWPDGLEFRAYDLWLFENTVGTSIDEATRESVFDPADLRADQVESETMAATVSLTDHGALRIGWAPGRQAHYHPGWLRHVADGRHRPDGWLPKPVPWLAADLAEPPTHDGAEVLAETGTDAPGRSADAWLADLLRYGIARLRDVGTDPDRLLNLVSPMGAIRVTNFGPIWDVRASPTPDSTANTTYRLCPHTDLPTRETPPGFQFLHCIENSVAGGYSTMADGLAVAAHLEANHPDHYQALTALNWVFFNRGPTVDHRWSGPILDLGGPGSPLTIRAFHPVRGFPDMAEDDMPRAYAALRCFSRVSGDPRFQLRYPFSPGDVIGFDNRRILHGRDGYESEGHRHLRGLYIDHDEVRSYARIRSRRHG